MSRERREGHARALCAALLVACLPGLSAADAQQPPPPPPGPPASAGAYVPGELLVRFRSAAAPGERAAARRRLDAALVRTLPVRGVELLRLERGASPRRAAEAFERLPEVLYAEPNFAVEPHAIPNDTRFGELWGLHNTGQDVGGVGSADADIDAPEAWDVTTGSRDVVVAVTDSGVEMRHPDLAGSGPAGSNLWTNPDETGSGRESNGVDDDGNGYVDDWRGWDFAGSDNDPTDFEGHGTHIAGTIGALGGNASGVAGVNHRVRIMPVNALAGGADRVASAFAYAADNGARVVNASFGLGGFSRVVEDVIEAHPNTLFVASAGNDRRDVDALPNNAYPCDSPAPNVVCVAATNPRDELAGFSNWGARSVDLAAPGVNVLSLGLPSRGFFEESFEEELGSRWVRGGTGTTWDRVTYPDNAQEWFLTDSPGTLYANDADGWIELTEPFDLTGASGCFLTYQFNQSLADGDVVRTEASYDGVTWTSVGEHRGTTMGSARRSLAAVEGHAGVRLRFRLTSNAAGQDWGFSADYLSVFCLYPPYRGDEYAYQSGTSMAAPHVSGAAALVLAHRPTATAVEVKEALLANVDPLSQLADRTVSGGRLNVNWALVGRPPPPQPQSQPEAGTEAADQTPVGAPPDTRPPACSLTLPRRQRPRTVRRRGLRLVATCDEPGRLAATLRVSLATARALGMRSRAAAVTLATTSVRLAAPGRRTLVLVLPPRTSPALARVRRLRGSVRLRATDAAGNVSSLTKRISLRR